MVIGADSQVVQDQRSTYFEKDSVIFEYSENSSKSGFVTVPDPKSLASSFDRRSPDPALASGTKAQEGSPRRGRTVVD